MAYNIISKAELLREVKLKASKDRYDGVRHALAGTDMTDYFRRYSRGGYEAVLEDYMVENNIPFGTKDVKLPKAIRQRYLDAMVEAFISPDALNPNSDADFKSMYKRFANNFNRATEEAKSANFIKPLDDVSDLEYDGILDLDVFSDTAPVQITPESVTIQQLDPRLDYLNTLLDESNLSINNKLLSTNDVINLIRDNNWDWILYDMVSEIGTKGISIGGYNYKLSTSYAKGGPASKSVVSGTFIRDFFSNMTATEEQALIDIAELLIGFTGEAGITSVSKDEVRKNLSGLVNKFIMSKGTKTPITTAEQQLDYVKGTNRTNRISQTVEI